MWPHKLVLPLFVWILYHCPTSLFSQYMVTVLSMASFPMLIQPGILSFVSILPANMRLATFFKARTKHNNLLNKLVKVFALLCFASNIVVDKYIFWQPILSFNLRKIGWRLKLVKSNILRTYHWKYCYRIYIYILCFPISCCTCSEVELHKKGSASSAVLLFKQK